MGLIEEGKWEFLWVTDFPLLEYDEEQGRYVAMHHPFTAPMDEDLPMLDSDPGSVRAKAYDCVLNGYEIGGGSIRIYNTELQSKMFDLLGLSKEQTQRRFGFLLEAFDYGTPPHGGLAFGLDRLVMLLAGEDNIRNVIAFPKVQNASELMSGAPRHGGRQPARRAFHQGVGLQGQITHPEKRSPDRGLFGGLCVREGLCRGEGAGKRTRFFPCEVDKRRNFHAGFGA